MDLAATRAYIRFDFGVIVREKVMIFFILALPAFMYAFFGLLFGNASYGTGNQSFYDEYTASFTGLVLLNVALMNIGPVLVIYKELGFFRRLLVTPLPMAAIGVSTILRSFIIFFIGYAEMLVIGYFMFGRVPQTPVLELAVCLLLCSFCLFSMGFLMSAVFRSANSAFNAGIFIFQPMLLLSGASFPMETFPRWLQQASQVLPMTHVVHALRLTWRDEFFTARGLIPAAVMIGYGLIFAVTAQRLFRWTSV